MNVYHSHKIFKPITIKLETDKEVVALDAALKTVLVTVKKPVDETSIHYDIIKQLQKLIEELCK